MLPFRGQEKHAHAVRAKDPLCRHRIGLTGRREEHGGQHWRVDKREIRGLTWENIRGCREGKEADLDRSATAKVGSQSKFEVESDERERLRRLGRRAVGRCMGSDPAQQDAATLVGPLSTPALQSLTEFKQDIYSRSTPSGHDESPLRIVDSAVEPRDHESIRQRVTSKWREPLTKEEQAVEWGFLYAYTVKENPKYVKIGYTSRDVATRHIEWQTACDRQVAAAYPVDSKDAVFSPIRGGPRRCATRS